MSGPPDLPHALSCDTTPPRRLTLGAGDKDGDARMHWHIYLVLAVGMAFVVIVDLASGRWARAGASALVVVFLGFAAWNGRAQERKARAAEMEAGKAGVPSD